MTLYPYTYAKSEIILSVWFIINSVDFSFAEGIPFNEMAIRYNGAMLEYCRTSVSALAGSSAGIIGLTGLYGFIFYFLASLVMSVCTVMYILISMCDWQKIKQGY
jgi:hypothetical protein